MTKRFLPLMICLILSLSIGGVYATWIFAEDPPTPVSDQAGVTLSLFDYKPEEILPGGDMEEAPLGENHFALIDLILNENKKGYGLNIKDDVVLHRYLNSNGIVYSNQKVSGGNLKFILDPKNNTHGLYYCIEKVSDIEYYAYTFSTNDLLRAGNVSIEITAYRTTLLKTDKWNATTSYAGYAMTKSLRELGESADPNTIEYSIDVKTWRPHLN